MASSSDLVALEVPRRSLLGASALAGAATLLGLGAFEAASRKLGFEAEVRDSPELWCDARQRALDLGSSGLVIVGSSRSQLGLDPKVLAPLVRPLVPVQLAINGSPALPVLGDLAADPSFRGTVLCEVMPQRFFILSSLKADAVPWIHYWRSRPSAGPLEGYLRREAQLRVVSIQPALDLRLVARRQLLRQGLPEPPFVHLRPDRYIEANYSSADTGRSLAQWVARTKAESTPLAEPDLARLLERVSAWCQAIRQRGGRVIFVRMISSLQLREIEDSVFPRADYWERLLQATSSPGIYDTDLPETKGLVCPEGSHLDAPQARVFSHALGVGLKNRRLI